MFTNLCEILPHLPVLTPHPHPLQHLNLSYLEQNVITLDYIVNT